MRVTDGGVHLERFDRFSQGLSLGVFVASIGVLFVNPWLTLGAVAVWMGWLQVGSL